jgi:DNA-binding transcriptional ArsR family regulator
MGKWSFLTNHARVLVCIADDPGVRLRDIAASLGITERTAFGIVTDLTEAGYVVKEKDGRRNRYRIQDHLPLPETVGRERTIGEVLRLLIDTPTPESAQLRDGNAASDRRAATRGKRSPRRHRKSPPPSELDTRSQRAPDSAARQDRR